jgi:hypothetical protein
VKHEITFTAFHRRFYLREAVSSWNQNGSQLLNWPVSYCLEPSDPSTVGVMIDEFNQLECADLTGVVNETRQGVLRNPYVALTQAFDYGNDFVILAEDDVVVSEDTIEYFEWAMETYKEDPNVLAVLAFSRISGEEGYPNPSLVSRTKVFCPLIWGTWSNRWDSIIKPNWDLDYSSGKPDGSEAGWDWNMMRLAVNHGMDFIYPHASRSNHIGKFGGTHTSEHSFPESQAASFREEHFKDYPFKEVYREDTWLYDYYPRPHRSA